MKCEHAIELMQRFVDNDLSEQETLVLNAHLRECPSCTLAFGRLKALHEQLLQLPKVTPKFSVVDSILPKLLAIDAQSREAGREEGAALAVADPEHSARQATEVREEPAHKRRFLGYVSWKMTGAVAVAACAALFFIWNQGGSPQPGRMADQAVGSKLPESAPGTAEPAAASPEQNELMKVFPTPTPTETPAQTKAVTTEPTHAPDKPSSKVTVLEKEKGKPSESAGGGARGATVTATPDVTPGTKETANTADGGSDVKDIAVHSPSPGLGGGVDMNSIASTAEESSNMKLEPPRNARVANDTYVAEVKEHKVTISSVATNEIVFASLRQWTGSERVLLVNWTPEGKFYYEVVGDGAVRAFLIDVANRTELQIPK